MQFVKIYAMLLFIGVLLFSCSKKEEVEEVIELSDFMIEVHSDFLLSTQKGYYLFSNDKGNIISEGILENGKKYAIPSSEGSSIHFTYILTTPDIQRTTIVANTFLNIEVSNSLILHKALNGSNAFPDVGEIKGQAKVNIDCFGGINYITIATQSNALFSLPDNSYPKQLGLFATEEEALAIRSTESTPTSANQFEYAIKNISIDRENTFVCSDFTDATNVMKSIQVDVSGTRNIGTGGITLSAIPNNFIPPRPLYLFGQIDFRSFDFSNSQTSTLWYMKDWIKSKREYMSITSQTYEYTSNNEVKKVYQQYNHGLYPPPSTLRLEIPAASIEIIHNKNKSVITQEGEQFIGTVVYQPRRSRETNNKIYAWALNFSGEEKNIEWTFPTLSSQMRSHLEIEENIFEKEIIPIAKYMSINEEYKDYNEYIKTVFKPYKVILYKAPLEWKVRYNITEYILDEGGIIYPYEINYLKNNGFK